MVQTSVDTCNNVNLDPWQKCVSGGERVSSCRPEGGSDKVEQFKIEGPRM